MGNFLMKTPLTAIIFAALWFFAGVFMPVSPGYYEVLEPFKMSLLGYVLTIAYGLWLSIIAALVIADTKFGGLKPVLLTFPAFLLTQWLAPMLQQIWFGEATGVMARSDLLFKLSAGAVATLLFMALILLLFKHPSEQSPAHTNALPHPADKYKIKKLDFAIKLIVLPVIYCVVYFLSWHFLLRRFEAARVYYGSPEYISFVKELVYMLLNDAKQVPLALLKGLTYTLGLLPLLVLLPAKRVTFIITSIMVLLGPAIQMLIPSPVMPDAVRTAHLIELAAVAVVYGGLAGIMLHTSMHKLEAPNPVPVPAKPAAKSAARPAVKSTATTAKS